MRPCICNLSIGGGAETTGSLEAHWLATLANWWTWKIRWQSMRQKPGINLGHHMHMHMYTTDAQVCVHTHTHTQTHTTTDRDIQWESFVKHRVFHSNCSCLEILLPLLWFCAKSSLGHPSKAHMYWDVGSESRLGNASDFCYSFVFMNLKYIEGTKIEKCWEEVRCLQVWDIWMKFTELWYSEQ